MKFCHNCGTQLNDTMKFCPHCGSEQSAPTANITTGSPTAPRNNHQLHCPKCKSTNIQATLESQTTDGGVLHVPLGNGIGVSNFSGKTTQHYDWLCLNCGVRFPNIQELERKLKSVEAAATLSIVCAVIALLATIYYLIAKLHVGLYITLPCVAIFGLIYIIAKKKIESDANMILYYKKYCFD